MDIQFCRPAGGLKKNVMKNENCGLTGLITDYQIHHLGNPSGMLDIFLKIDPCHAQVTTSRRGYLQGSVDLLQ